MSKHRQYLLSLCAALVPSLFLTWDEMSITRLILFTTLYALPLAWLFRETLATYVYHTKPSWEAILIRGLTVILVWTLVAFAQQLAASAHFAQCTDSEAAYTHKEKSIVTGTCASFSSCPDDSPWWYLRTCD